MATVSDLIATVRRFMAADVTQQLATLVDERPAVIQKAVRVSGWPARWPWALAPGVLLLLGVGCAAGPAGVSS
jgi:hypothetical protein